MPLLRDLVQHRQWYAKVAIVSAIFGAAIEGFMIKTGFYDKVTLIEAQRRAELHQALREGGQQQLSYQEFKSLLNERFGGSSS